MAQDTAFEAVLRIASLLREKGGRSYLVGGCVRDGLLGLPVKDYDVEVYGLSAEQICEALSGEFGLDLVGASFGVLKVSHLDIDISLPRIESKNGAGHRGFDVTIVPNLSVEEASARRDFTINALMREPLSGELIDCWNGVSDLKSGVIRHVSSHFAEDELRVLRAMQFAARFGFRVAPETVALCATLSQDELPIERIGGEWEKMLLKGQKPSHGLRFLQACGWLRFYPELEALVGCPQNPRWHPEGDVWTHTLGVVDAAASLRGDDTDDNLVLMLAALCHDFGKPATTTNAPDDGRIISHGHDVAGEEPARRFLARIWNRTDLPRRVIPLVRHHMRPMSMICQNATPRSYRKLALEVNRMDLLAMLAKADIIGVGEIATPKEQSLACVDRFLERARELAVEQRPPCPLVQGRHLVRLGWTPGPAFKPILDACFEAQLDGLFTDEQGGIEYLVNTVIPKHTSTR